MIYLFRKEIKKWHSVLWVVFASLSISGVSLIFWRSPQGANDLRVATVNGIAIPFKQYRRSLANVQQSMNVLREYARMYGMSEEMFLKTFFGQSNPYDLAVNNCIKESLMDTVKNSLHITVESQYLQEHILKTLPKGLIDAQGTVNMDSYQRYLQNLATTPTDYEQEQEEDLKRKLVERFINASYYNPFYAATYKLTEEKAVKSFVVSSLEFDDFLKKAKAVELSDSELQEFYNKNKEQYRIPERKKAVFWQLSAEKLEKDIVVNDQAISAFYEKNKTAMFRNPPQVNVRHILIEIPAHAKEGERKAIFEKAQKIHQDVTKDAQSFSNYVKKFSDDANSIKNGGLTGFFKRGSRDKVFEHAAFRLQNKGDLSGVIKTAQGYEILQLEDRLNATYKPLTEVSSEITKTIKSKKALAELKSQLSLMLHKSRADENYIEQFAQEHNLKKEESNWIVASMPGELSLEKMFAQKLFTSNAQASKLGYFFNDGVYTIYKQIDHQASYIKKFDDVKDQVKESCYKMHAYDSLHGTAKKIKEALLLKKISLQEAALAHHAKTFHIENVSKNSVLKNFKNEQAAKERLFVLSDSSQILQYKEGDSIYLIQLIKSEYPAISTDLDVEATKIIKNEKIKNSHHQSVAFIASLQRNAKIEVNNKVLKSIGKAS